MEYCFVDAAVGVQIDQNSTLYNNNFLFQYSENNNPYPVTGIIANGQSNTIEGMSIYRGFFNNQMFVVCFPLFCTMY